MPQSFASLVCRCSAQGVNVETCLKLFFALLILNYCVSSTETPTQKEPIQNTLDEAERWFLALLNCKARSGKMDYRNPGSTEGERISPIDFCAAKALCSY